MRYSEPYLRLASEQLIYVSAAAGELLPEEADLYEAGDVLALVGNPNGAYHLGRKSGGRNARMLSSLGVVSYLADKFDVDVGTRFPAWSNWWNGRSVVLFSQRETGRPFGPEFRPVTVPYRKLIEGRVLIEGNQILLPAQAVEDTLAGYAAYSTDEAVVLRTSPVGPLGFLPRANPRYLALDSQELVAYCRRKFGQKPRLRALQTQSGIYISKNEEALYRASRCKEPHFLDIIPTPRVYLTLNSRWTMYLSGEAGRWLEGRVNVLEHNGLLALRSDPKGTLEVSPCAQGKYCISSKHLKERILYRYPNQKRLLLVRYQDMLLLTPDGRLPTNVPPTRDFCRLNFFQPKAGVSWLRLGDDGLQVSRWASKALQGAFSALEGAEGIMLVNRTDGIFTLYEAKNTINSAALVRFIEMKFGLHSGDRLHAEHLDDGLLVWPEGRPRPDPLTKWAKIDNQFERTDRTLSALISGSQVGFSVRASLALREQVALVSDGERILVVNRQDGPYPVHSKGRTGRKYISSVAAVRWLQQRLGEHSHYLYVEPVEGGLKVYAADTDTNNERGRLSYG